VWRFASFVEAAKMLRLFVDEVAVIARCNCISVHGGNRLIPVDRPRGAVRRIIWNRRSR
jgi:hypothetical protein